MIYGATRDERNRKKELAEKKQAVWHKWFAWYPVSLENGRRAWFQFVETRTYFHTYIYIKARGMWATEYRIIK